MNPLKVAALITLLAAAVSACSTSTPAPSEPLTTPRRAEAAPVEEQPAETLAGAEGQGDGELPEAPEPAPKHDPNNPLSPPPDVAAAPDDAIKTVVKHDGGEFTLSSKIIKAGDGEAKPTDADIVEVHYTGWTTDGNMFDSSLTRGRTLTFPLDGVIPGWREAVKLMVAGEKRRVWIPEELAYKNGPSGAPKGMLVFDIELIEIVSTSADAPGEP